MLIRPTFRRKQYLYIYVCIHLTPYYNLSIVTWAHCKLTRGWYLSINNTIIFYCKLIVHIRIYAAPPTVPQLVMSSEVGRFSATISWSPPSDNGGSDHPLKYSINITNNTVTLSFTTSDVTTLLQYLQHSTQYTVTIMADNDLGLGPSPPAVINFTTPDSGM